jgi:hypothetical protein
MNSLMNIMWPQSAPVAFQHIGWKFYLAFIIPGTLACIALLLFFPDTKGLPLEEIAAPFRDEDEVAVYQSEIIVDANSYAVVDHHGEKQWESHPEMMKSADTTHVQE